MIKKIKIVPFSILLPKLWHAVNNLEGAETVRDLEIYNIIKYEYIQELIIAAINNPDEEFIFVYNVGLHAITTIDQFIDLCNANGGNEALLNDVTLLNRFSTAFRLYCLDTIKQQKEDLAKILKTKNFLELSFKEQCIAVNSEIGEVFSKFETFLKEKNINNISFKSLYSINNKSALTISSTIIIDESIDLLKNEAVRFKLMQLSKLGVINDYIIFVLDWDALNDLKLLLSLENMSLNVAFTMFKREPFNMISHRALLFKGDLALEIMRRTNKICKTLSEQKEGELCFDELVNQNIRFYYCAIRGLMDSILNKDNLNNDLIHGNKLTSQWNSSCAENGIYPLEQQVMGESWHDREDINKQLTKECNLNTFVSDYLNLLNGLKINFSKNFTIEKINYISMELSRLD